MIVKHFQLLDGLSRSSFHFPGVRGMPGQPMPNHMGLGPMSSQRPSIVAGTGRMPPLPHHPDHGKPEVQSAMADSTSMQQQQQHQRGQLSPRQADSSRLMAMGSIALPTALI